MRIGLFLSHETQSQFTNPRVPGVASVRFNKATLLHPQIGNEQLIVHFLGRNIPLVRPSRDLLIDRLGREFLVAWRCEANTTTITVDNLISIGYILGTGPYSSLPLFPPVPSILPTYTNTGGLLSNIRTSQVYNQSIQVETLHNAILIKAYNETVERLIVVYSAIDTKPIIINLWEKANGIRFTSGREQDAIGTVSVVTVRTRSVG
jgi:hypothetical protein